MNKRVTSYDVAQMAGVSQATVSYVLNGNSRQTISEETRQRVLSSARQLNYYSNNAARSLKRNQTGCISVVIDKQIEHPRYGETLQALREKLDDQEYRVLLCKNQSSGNTPDFIRDYLEKRVDGIIYIGADSVPVSRQAMTDVKRYKIPFTALDCGISDPTIASVDIDYRYGMRQAISKLTEIGCAKIIYVCPDSKTGQETLRSDEFLLACEQSKLPGELFPLHLNRYLTYEKTGLTYVEWLSAVRSEIFGNDLNKLAEKLRLEPDSTGIICSWRAMRDLVLIPLIKEKREMPVVTLTHEPVPIIYQGRMFHSALPNRACGSACAEAILNQIRGIETVHKVLLRPGDIAEDSPY